MGATGPDACHAAEHGTHKAGPNYNQIPSHSGTIQSRLSSMLADIHALSRQAQRQAHANAKRCVGTYEKHLAALLDEWIAKESGSKQLVCIACAAELGVLNSHHLDLGKDAVGKTDDRALRALYWSVSKRLVQSVTSSRRDAAINPLQSATSLVKPCVACCELARDNRRSFPHPRLESLAMAPLRENPSSPPVSTFSCSACSTRWVRRMGTFDLFAAWTISG